MKRFLFSLLILFCNTLLMKGQQYQYCFHYLSTGDGLSNSCVTCLLEDHRGCIWIGTESGANLFDGYSVRRVATPVLEGRSFRDNVYSIQEDHIGNVWVNYGNGYIVYTDLTTYQDGDSYLTSFGVPLTDQGHIHIDKSGNIWSMDCNYVYYYDLKTGNNEKYKSMLKFDYQQELMVEDFNGMLYIFDDENLWRFDRNGAEGMRWTNIEMPDELKATGDRFRFYVSTSGNLWFYSYQQELVFRKKRGTNDYEKVTFPQEEGVGNNQVRAIGEDKGGDIWIATDHRGVFIYTKELEFVKNIRKIPFRSETLISDNCAALLCDHRGTMWIGHYKRGISFTHPSFSLLVNHQGEYNDVSELLMASDGKLWIGTDGFGLFCEDQKYNLTKIKEIPNIIVSTLVEDPEDQSIWVASFSRGIFNIKGNTIKRYNVEGGNLQHNNTWYMCMDGEGIIWYLSAWNALAKLDPKTGKSETYLTTKGETVHGNYLTYDREGEIVIVGSYVGVMAIDPSGVETIYTGNQQGSQPFQNNQISTMLVDRKNEIWWLGHDNGMTIWDRRTDHIYLMSRDNGLCDNSIKSIIQDNSGVVWVSTSKGLMSIEAKRQESTGSLSFINKTYTTSEGLDVNYFNAAATVTPNGRVLFGSASGYVEIDPNNISTDFEKALVPEILECNVSGKLVPMNVLRRLNYKDYQIVISFFTKELIETDCVQFAYKLKGMSDAWIYTRVPRIQFMTLPPGDYTLEIKACGADGDWGPPMALPIHVDAPFYLTLWMKAIYVLLGLLFVAFVVLYFISRHKAKMRNLQAELEHEQAVRMSEMKLQFFTNMSHDLRTPLTLIMAPIESLLKEETFTEAITAKLKLIHKNANVLYQQVGSLLDYRRLDVGGETLRMHQQDFINFVNDICNKFSDYAIDRKIKFAFEHEDSRIITQFDTDKMGKVMYNLLSNAFKFTPDKGSITVVVKKEGDKITVEVADTGRGISDDDKKNIFKRFYQAEDASGTIGSGIGLSIVEGYVKMHNGTVSVRDNTPRGTVFFFSIPIVWEASVEDESELTVTEEVGKRPFTLLVVDDNRDLCTFISDSLKDEYNVINAFDGKEAIETLVARDVDLVLSDVMMPKLNGLELTERIKNDINISHIPVLLLTAKASEQARLEGLKAGADDYITKPFNIEHLRLRIRKFIELSKQRSKDFEQKIDLSPAEMTYSALDEMLLKKALDIVDQHINDPDFSVEVLGKELDLSRGHLYKKLMSITGHGPLEFIRTIRLKKGKYLLEQGDCQVTEVAYMVGFSNLKTFTENFKAVYGMTPTDYLHTIKAKK